MRADLFGVYVHWPFCASKCPYCDFNSHVAQTIDHARWRAAYRAEIDYYASLTKGRRVTSIFFGGGTPSLMEPETVQTVIDTIQKCWPIANDIEITLEANPTSVEAGNLQSFRTAGVNRVSLGVQSLVDSDLKFLGRGHSAAEAVAAIDMARKIFDRYSFDLMYARPQQTLHGWEGELSAALKYAGGHLSLYQLTIEKGTPFYGLHRDGAFTMPDSDAGGAFYELTQSIMQTHGLPAYEVSNHARTGAESLHNLTYWRYGDYAGIGPGAHGRLTLNGAKIATRAHHAPDIWLEHIAQAGHGAHPFENISGEQARQERVMMGLRLREGMDISGLALDLGKIRTLQDEGLVSYDEPVLKPTLAGLQRLNAILGYLL